MEIKKKISFYYFIYFKSVTEVKNTDHNAMLITLKLSGYLSTETLGNEKRSQHRSGLLWFTPTKNDRLIFFLEI